MPFLGPPGNDARRAQQEHPLPAQGIAQALQGRLIRAALAPEALRRLEAGSQGQPPQDQLPGVRHGRRQRRRRVKGPEGRGQGLGPPQGADACRLRRAVGQRGPSPQPGQQHLAVGGIHAASVLRAVYRHHRPGDHYHVPAGGGKGRLRMVKKRHVTARQVVQDLLAAVLRADNKIPLHAAVHKLLRRPGQHRAEQDRLQHQRLILGGQSTLQVKNRNFTIHGNHPPFYNPSHYIMLCVKIQYFCVFFWQ